MFARVGVAELAPQSKTRNITCEITKVATAERSRTWWKERSVAKGQVRKDVAFPLSIMGSWSFEKHHNTAAYCRGAVRLTNSTQSPESPLMKGAHPGFLYHRTAPPVGKALHIHMPFPRLPGCPHTHRHTHIPHIHTPYTHTIHTHTTHTHLSLIHISEPTRRVVI